MHEIFQVPKASSLKGYRQVKQHVQPFWSKNTVFQSKLVHGMDLVHGRQASVCGRVAGAAGAAGVAGLAVA